MNSAFRVSLFVHRMMIKKSHSQQVSSYGCTLFYPYVIRWRIKRVDFLDNSQIIFRFDFCSPVSIPLVLRCMHLRLLHIYVGTFATSVCSWRSSVVLLYSQLVLTWVIGTYPGMVDSGRIDSTNGEVFRLRKLWRRNRCIEMQQL